MALIGLACLLVASGTYAIVKGHRQPAPIVIESAPSGPQQAQKSSPGTGAAPSGDPAAQLPGDVVVQVAGAVKKPGVVHLAKGARVDDALRAAGGAGADADLDAVNLAAALLDGTQVFVPHKAGLVAAEPKPDETAKVAPPYRGGSVAPEYSPGRVLEGATDTTPNTGSPSGSHGRKEPPSQPIDVNTAGLDELQQVPGIGPATAQRILDYRRDHGKFGSLDELMAVKGIGQKRLDSMRKYLRL